jgi:hypothetical protein
MQHLSSEEITSKCGLVLGTITASLTLAEWDLVLAIILKIVSIISFTVVIALNVDKLSSKLKTWFK